MRSNMSNIWQLRVVIVLVILMHCFLERNHYIQKSIGTLPPIEEERQQLEKKLPVERPLVFQE